MQIQSLLAVLAFASAPAAPSQYRGVGPLLLVAFIAAIIVYDRYQRQQALKALAVSRRLEFLGKTLPPDFPRNMLGKLGSWYHVGRWRRSANVISGMEGNDRLVAFDAVVGRGRYQFRQTWVARRVSRPSNAPAVAEDMLYRQAGPWRAVAQKRQLLRGTRMNAATIAEMWQRLL
jgi:hypothetical protein